MDKLKPCPFCGEEDDIHPYADEVICGSCGCHVGSMHKTKEINIDIWNTRVEAQAEIDELQATLDGMAEINLDDQQKHAKEIDRLKAEKEQIRKLLSAIKAGVDSLLRETSIGE